MKTTKPGPSDSRMEVQLLTVGTGTAGKDSFVAGGIAAAILHDRPAAAYLVPSIAPESIAVADLVRQACREGGYQTVHLGEAGEIFQFRDPDSIEACREDFDRFLRVLRTTHPKARLAVNPTSGTKQMTAAAVIAALDLGIGELRFISGPRRDGVVISGQERISRFNTRGFMALRAQRLITNLIVSGAYAQAANEAAGYMPELQSLNRQARLYEAWDRLDYPTALRVARESDEPFCRKAQAVIGPVLGKGAHSIERVADLAAAAARSIERQRPEEAVARLYRMLEALAKFRLASRHRTAETDRGYPLDDLGRLLPRKADDYRRQARGGDSLWLGLRQLFEVLQALDDDFGATLVRHPDVRDLMEMRNQSIFGHGGKPVPPEAFRKRFNMIIALITRFYTDFPDRLAACAFDPPSIPFSAGPATTHQGSSS